MHNLENKKFFAQANEILKEKNMKLSIVIAVGENDECTLIGHPDLDENTINFLLKTAYLQQTAAIQNQFSMDCLKAFKGAIGTPAFNQVKDQLFNGE